MAAKRVAYQWHPEIHEHWGGEQLYFWKLAFAPTYDRERIVSGIRSAIELQGATAYTAYELFAGGYDIFLRIWLSTSQGAFEAELHQALSAYNVVAQPFWVNRILTHWPWETEPGSLQVRKVATRTLRHRLPDAEIARINQGGLTVSERTNYEKLNLIAPLRRRKGVKFFTVISSNGQGRTSYAKERLEERMREVLGAAANIFEKSLYQGVGFGEYLIMGRVTDYFAIERELTQPLNAAVDPSTYGARTTTFPVSRPDFLDSSYGLRVPDEVGGVLEVETALQEDESQALEVKGSAFASLDRWLTGDGQLVREDRIIDEGLLKAVTGLLNAEGGSVVVGAVEAQRYEKHRQLGECPRRGQYLVVGIEIDIDGSDWDKYTRKIRTILEKRVRPDPNTWVAFDKQVIDGRTVMIVHVRHGDRWFYHYSQGESRPRFWVRQGNRTVELAGPESDTYRHEKPR